ncbi:sulfatase [Stratiformator vulcanicus]|uniref:Arylsulfatase n=1 Tax=Stratiformator vulcanicus TaxID=2527980 RepID=A0A517R353_9PLAN|nr:sulfatase [Stratiformator vulcanicus]QDT38291.1 Arylsulfatase [Stratiformator vulcanicus]
MRPYIRLTLTALALTSVLPTLAAIAEETKAKNVVFFLVDDLGWTDLGCYGSTFYETPNIDRLAATGMKFTNAYAACPVCSPTRASILTGKYPQRVGITTFINPAGNNQPENWKRDTKMLPAPYADRLPHAEITLAEALREEGYATFFAGKWHLGAEGFFPEDQGFDVNKGGVESGGPYRGKKYFSPYGNPRLEDGPPGEHLPARLAEETATFIAENSERPFLAYLSFYSVHTPLMGRADLVAKYKEKRKELNVDGELWGRVGSRRWRQVQEHAVYAAMVDAMDQAVGRVLDELERQGLADETLVILTSDNGGLSTSEGHPTTNLPLKAGKGWMYEGGIREPLLVRWPGVTEGGSVSDAVVTSPDFYPTILDIVDLPARAEQHVDGVSFVPALEGSSFERGPIYWHFPHYGNQGGSPAGAVRDGNWKLIEFYENDHVELYDLAKDVGETNDLAKTEPKRVSRMLSRLREFREKTNSKMPTLR